MNETSTSVEILFYDYFDESFQLQDKFIFEHWKNSNKLISKS